MQHSWSLQQRMPNDAPVRKTRQKLREQVFYQDWSSLKRARWPTHVTEFVVRHLKCHMRFIISHKKNPKRWSKSEVNIRLNTLQWMTSSEQHKRPTQPLPCVTWKCSVLSLRELFVTQPFYMQMLCLWFLLIRHFRIAVDRTVLHTRAVQV